MSFCEFSHLLVSSLAADEHVGIFRIFPIHMLLRLTVYYVFSVRELFGS